MSSPVRAAPSANPSRRAAKEPTREALLAALAGRERELAEARERQAATAEILKVIASSPSDMQPVFDAIATSANRLLGGFSTAVFRIFGDVVSLAAFTPVDPDGRQSPRGVLPSPAPRISRVRAIRGGEFAQIPDTESGKLNPGTGAASRLS